MKCKACNDKTNQRKAGKRKAGKRKAGKTKTETQKYKCKICGKYYVLEGKKRGYSEEIKKQAIKLYIEGNSKSSSRPNYENREKYVPVLYLEICEKY